MALRMSFITYQEMARRVLTLLLYRIDHIDWKVSSKQQNSFGTCAIKELRVLEKKKKIQTAVLVVMYSA